MSKPTIKQGPWVAIDDDHADWGEADRARLVATDPSLALGEPSKFDELATKLRAAALVHRVIDSYRDQAPEGAGILELAALALEERAIDTAEAEVLVALLIERRE